jgi:hypothetical protein
MIQVMRIPMAKTKLAGGSRRGDDFEVIRKVVQALSFCQGYWQIAL